MRTNTVLAFAGGVVVGLIGGIIIADIYYKKSIDEAFDSYDEALKAKERYSGESNKKEDEPNVSDGVPKKREKHEKVAYNKFYKKQYEEDETDLSEDGVNEEDELEELEMKEYHDTHFEKAPEIVVGPEDFQKMPDWYDKRTLQYYQWSDDLVDVEEDEPLMDDEIDILFGDLLQSSGFTDNDEEYIDIRNYQTDTHYHIEKVFASYSDDRVVVNDA